jgi:hypothetical protein
VLCVYAPIPLRQLGGIFIEITITSRKAVNQARTPQM